MPSFKNSAHPRHTATTLNAYKVGAGSTGLVKRMDGTIHQLFARDAALGSNTGSTNRDSDKVTLLPGKECHLFDTTAKTFGNLRHAVSPHTRKHDDKVLIVEAGHHVVSPAQAILKQPGYLELDILSGFEAEIPLLFGKIVDGEKDERDRMATNDGLFPRCSETHVEGHAISDAGLRVKVRGSNCSRGYCWGMHVGKGRLA